MVLVGTTMFAVASTASGVVVGIVLVGAPVGATYPAGTAPGRLM